MNQILLETETLLLRRMTKADLPHLSHMLKDPDVMYAYEGSFDDEEVAAWLQNQFRRYQTPGLGLNAVILKETGAWLGQCGLTMQPTPDGEALEVGYLFLNEYWHRGYATQAAHACMRYGFDVLGAKEICSIIRDSNTASRNVALRNGMQKRGEFVKHYRGVDMPHDIYSISKEAFSELFSPQFSD